MYGVFGFKGYTWRLHLNQSLNVKFLIWKNNDMFVFKVWGKINFPYHFLNMFVPVHSWYYIYQFCTSWSVLCTNIVSKRVEWLLKRKQLLKIWNNADIDLVSLHFELSFVIRNPNGGEYRCAQFYKFITNFINK